MYRWVGWLWEKSERGRTCAGPLSNTSIGKECEGVVTEIARDQLVWNPWTIQETALYSQWNKKLLKSFKQGSAMIWNMFREAKYILQNHTALRWVALWFKLISVLFHRLNFWQLILEMIALLLIFLSKSNFKFKGWVCPWSDKTITETVGAGQLLCCFKRIGVWSLQQMKNKKKKNDWAASFPQSNSQHPEKWREVK